MENRLLSWPSLVTLSTNCMSTLTTSGVGLGKALLDHARSLSPEHLWLYTLQINANGRAFYEKNGFRRVKLGISPAPESEPDVEYHWGAME